MMRRWRAIIIPVAIIDFLAILVLVVVSIIEANKSVILDIALVPSTAKVLINGREYGSGVHKAFPSDVVTATIRAEGFEDKKIEIKLEKDGYVKINDYLMPGEGNLNYYAQHDEEANSLAKVGGADAQAMLKIIAIKRELPIISFKYGGLNGQSTEIVIDRNNNCQQFFCLVVTGLSREKQNEVAEILANKGYNIEEYDVSFR